MKKLVNKFLVILTLPLIMSACEDDDSKDTVDFLSIASSYSEADGNGTVTIPLRNGSVNENDITFGGTATLNADFTLVGVTAEGIQIAIIDDDSLESLETLDVRILSSNGNNTHTITILSNCEDVLGVTGARFTGSWAALEDYGSSTFGPYNVTLTLDATNPNKLTFPNFYGGGATYTVFLLIDGATGTVSFPNQTVGAPTNDRGPITLSSGTFDLCEETMTINLNYDGADWTYRFTKN